MIIKGKTVPVEIETELNRYNWERANWSSEKLIACSPFRNENHPSFAVNLETGVWIDSGSSDDRFRKGNFIKLLSFLRRETYEETEEYLFDEYGTELIDVDNVELKINIQDKEKEERIILSKELLKPFRYKHSYLEGRGLTQKTQRAVKIGFDPETRSIVIPWLDKDENLVNWKHRSISSKWFWYAEHGDKIKNHLYGLYLVYKLDRKDEVFVVESEIDALTLWQSGYSAVATGSASLSKNQAKLLRKAGIKKLVIATDNDDAGERAKKSIKRQLGGFMELEEIIFPEGRKDINDFTEKELKNIQTKPSFGLSLEI